MTSRYVVTFEFTLLPPQTHRGTVTAGRASTCVARAVKDAQKVLRPVNWSSVVCVLLERGEDLRSTDEVRPSDLAQP